MKEGEGRHGVPVGTRFQILHRPHLLTFVREVEIHSDANVGRPIRSIQHPL
jgi:hypothetical protein